MLIAKGERERERERERDPTWHHRRLGGLIVDTSIFINSTDNFNYLLL